MTVTLDGMVKRRRAALRDKLDALALDFAQWEALSAPGKAFEKHHTQVKRLVRRLGRLRQALDDDIGKLRTDSESTMARGHALERDVLLLHSMWEFYRSRLSQRLVPGMKRFLDAADDYAWACLQPVITAAVAAKHVTAASVREPPLTFLNSEWSPFASTRGTALMSEAISPSETERQAFIREVKSLPLSVLGLPWYQLSHLPDVLILAHEIGHVVEDDLDLTASLSAALEATIVEHAIPADRASAWRAWLGEGFADTFGAVAGGRAFGCALADFVTLDVKAVRAEALAFPNWGVYPTTALRLRLVAGALDVLDDAAGVTEILDRCSTLMNGEAPMTAFDVDCAHVARGWLKTPLDALGGKSLLTVARVPATHWKGAEAVSSSALRSAFPLPSSDVRVLVSGARIAFEQEPEKYRLPTVKLDAKAGDVQSLVLAQLEATRKAGVRSREAPSAGAKTLLEAFDDAEAERQVARFSSQAMAEGVEE